MDYDRDQGVYQGTHQDIELDMDQNIIQDGQDMDSGMDFAEACDQDQDMGLNAHQDMAYDVAQNLVQDIDWDMDQITGGDQDHYMDCDKDQDMQEYRNQYMDYGTNQDMNQDMEC